MTVINGYTTINTADINVGSASPVHHFHSITVTRKGSSDTVGINDEGHASGGVCNRISGSNCRSYEIDKAAHPPGSDSDTLTVDIVF
ncbi:fimbrial adhesin [Enterobacter sp. FY-07]|uniref:hypothetical protein n=1 Tax=Kosakonia oryzendophytica TaxID=1005665 RepID=UPI000777AB9D|nr:hypothetical protein [Kosakonia oryzendophytica]AMO48419.1 fimbrial adhesin [Enterobacter sp. FY-07]WBT60051.1 hypothetical protein O9K67_09930 [Kosakonia oryzendophytica]